MRNSILYLKQAFRKIFCFGAQVGEQFLFTNRLIREKSPYLLQHAHNPVDWYAWGEDAFKEAREKDKPIFLSIGYATCHWCHTMENESFQNVEIAEWMNRVFVNIKVDREELPDVDALYMDFAQSMMAGSAGWPLNVILTPNLEPFFAATYLPPAKKQGMMGLIDLIKKIEEIWNSDDRYKVEFQAKKIVEFFAGNMKNEGEQLPTLLGVLDAAEILYKIADPIYGGLRGAPKFPVGYQYNFLLSCAYLKQDSRALFLVERTLEMIHRGGIYDHIGGGISRYSVDERWLIPHFEKMLYDNALIAESYIDAWRFTKKKTYRKVAEDVLSYALRVMMSPEGGFYSAEDADSEGHEGKFYTWKYEELERLLGKSRFDTFADFYGVSFEGNFDGSNVLYTSLSLEEFANKRNLDLSSLEKELAEDHKILFEYREKREHPFKDDKILTSWNGLMIHSLVKAGSAFNIPRFTEAALRSIDFVKHHLFSHGTLFRRWREGESYHPGGLDDYAFLIRALLTLFEHGHGMTHLNWAIELTNHLEVAFKSENGAFYQNDGRDPSLIIRRCQFSDGAEPSGNAIHCENLMRLYAITKDQKFMSQAEDILKAVQLFLGQFSPGYFYHSMNISRYYAVQSPTYVISLNEEKDHFETLKKTVAEHYHPFAGTVFLEPKDLLASQIFSSYPTIDNKTTLYICTRERCLPPITDVHEMVAAIAK